MIIAAVAVVLLCILAGALYMLSAFFAYHLYKYRVIRHTNQAYDNDGDLKHRLDVYLPKHTDTYPVVHFFHGGYWISGDKNYRQIITGLYGNIGVTLAQHGIGVVISNYRLGPAHSIDDQLQDAADAIKWTLQNTAHTKFFLMGHSAGGHIASLLASSPKLCQKLGVDHNQLSGCIALSPILDIPDLIAHSSSEENTLRYYPIFGTDPTKWPSYSPQHQLETAAQNKQLPFVLISGSKDYQTIIRQVQAAAASLTTATKLLLPNYKHTHLVTKFGKRNVLTKSVVDFVLNQREQ